MATTKKSDTDLMIRTFTEALMLWGFGASGSGIASIGLSEYLGSSGSHVISESTLLPLGLFVGGVLTTSIVVWKVATHAKSIEVTLKEFRRRLENLEKRRK